MTLRQQIIVGVSLAMGFLIAVLTILTLYHGVSQWARGDQAQDNTIHLDLSGIPNASRVVDNEMLNGSGRNQTLRHAPTPATSLHLYLNGQHLLNGSEHDSLVIG